MLQLSPRQCVVIEDSISGVMAGKQAGCITVAVPNQFTQHHDLLDAALNIESFADISVDQFLQMLAR